MIRLSDLKQEIITARDITLYRPGHNTNPLLQVMVIGLEGQTVYLGDGTTIQVPDLIHLDNWSFVINPFST